MKTGDRSAALIRRLWQFCSVLRDDGLSYPDYVEQLTYLLFLKMLDERSPHGDLWRTLTGLESGKVGSKYDSALKALSREEGSLGIIFRGAKNKISDPAKLRLLVELIDATEWTQLSPDVKGDAYEGLLEKNARDTKSGAGQYFTPRPLIDAVVECVAPKLGDIVCDPACGTGGFLLAAADYLQREPLTETQRRHLRTSTFRGVELVPEVARLAAMNLYLHGIADQVEGPPAIQVGDSLTASPDLVVDVVLTNPPFGTKGSVMYAADDQRRPRQPDDLTVSRPDFWANTANKQLNFLQHTFTLLRPGGRAALVVPDNVLYEGGAAATIRRELLQRCHVHTLLRLPTGLFYAHGVKANVLFFDKQPPTRSARLRVYDLRSGRRQSLKTNPLRRSDLDEFVDLYNSARDGTGSRRGESSRCQDFSIADLLESTDVGLDLSWDLTQPEARPSGLTRLDQIASEVATELRTALAHLDAATGERPLT